MRDRRWDFLYDRQRQPVKAYLLERFAEELARELEAWPPPEIPWESEAERARWGHGAAERPRDDVLRLALELARLDLVREYDEVERRRAREAHRLQTPAEHAALHLLVRLVTEACLELKERAEGAHLTRADLAGVPDLLERRLFRVTL
ncbi:hypothetical protein [Anaeromyxobacter dehalogenans]|uniref:Uncharacterized protein n=1 Tax=Anaeromyxobacter dehalogenans (strain 2CP-C) TaxID=290397 RepID=Q2IGW8_ANADE|nr:hypothetical protein [Anaeromyxobacter dehalogenans]ABC83825.1 hypothetical protein Adeh_4061 [Anaeromyxobacter dehalogenans 2CP-C]